ncbi:MAG: GTPase HflX [Hyphomicrobiales bacterium]
MRADRRKSGDGVRFQIEGRPATRAIIVHVEFKHRKADRGTDRHAESRLSEAVELAEAIDLEIVSALIVPLAAPRPATLLGSGKVAEIGQLTESENVELVVVNAELAPIQQRNLERAWKTKVLDRTGLILEIFGRRARTREGVLQVELAHLQYQKSRLVRSWTHLERQRGGFGFLGGPGESQLESDRRLIQERIDRIEKQLEAVKTTRSLHRTGRARVPYPIVALVGYTNAGKSTLFNALTKAGVLAKDLLFATLDPAMRAVTLPHGRKVVFSDTVGFISDLPTTLIAAFRATLEEVLSADVILHVRDISHLETEPQAADVASVLAELGIAREDPRIVEFWNKADLLDESQRDMRRAQAHRRKDCILGSALTGDGLDALLATIEDRLAESLGTYEVILPAQEGRGLAWLHDNGEVLSRQARPDGSTVITVRLAPDRAARAPGRLGVKLRPVDTLSRAAE